MNRNTFNLLSVGGLLLLLLWLLSQYLAKQNPSPIPPIPFPVPNPLKPAEPVCPGPNCPKPRP